MKPSTRLPFILASLAAGASFSLAILSVGIGAWPGWLIAGSAFVLLAFREAVLESVRDDLKYERGLCERWQEKAEERRTRNGLPVH